MTNAEILEKAIAQAEIGGYKSPLEKGWRLLKGWPGKNFEVISEPFSEEYQSVVDIIFDHDFAKAFWGEHQIGERCGTPMKKCKSESQNKHYHCEEYWCQCSGVKAWTYHLQHQVISDDPIKYLKKGLNELEGESNED